MPSLDTLEENDGRNERNSVLGKSCEIVDGKCLPYEVNGLKLPKRLFAFRSKFYLNGRPFLILSGAFHYFRTLPEQWGDRILKMQAAGLNTVETYVPWNLHEPYDGMIHFGGRWNLVDFIKMVHKLKMKMIIRPGPYICSEWEFGGLPSWLLRQSTIKLRSHNKEFLSKVTRYFSRLLPLLAQYQYSTGNGPIIAFQLENEYGAYVGGIKPSEKTSYLLFLKSLFKTYGINELIFTSDSSGDIGKSRLPGTLMTINFQTQATKHLNELKTLQPDRPLFVAEWWTGWFDHWFEKHHIINLESFEHELLSIIANNASINFYMMVGGTNFGFWNGANNHSIESGYQPTITSYDYDAPITEDGRLSNKFFIIRRILEKLSQTPLPEPPSKSHVIKPRSYDLTPFLSLSKLVKVIGQLANYQTKSNYMLNMESLDVHSQSGQSFGFLHLQSHCPKSTKQLLLKGVVRDRMYIYVDRKLKKILTHREEPTNIIELSGANEQCKIELLLENMGRVNYGNVLNIQHKGFLEGEIFADGVKIKKWLHTVIDFSEEIIEKIANEESYVDHSLPNLYKTEFNLDDKIGDTFIDTSDFGKGIILVNDFLLGKYWNAGPQRTLYLPAPLLRNGKNTVVVFELEKNITKLKFSNKPMLGKVTLRA
ncbi:unnamed protein product [Dimorphilus gyrociliatus]|uniref:Uncharacterized protein n=1 Tax=Dimorphilus gyrociliatus TaxID=2664684 RepID=A0A7I8VG92_9ANNE|nr:unnamed protein product [Dimorphilus gyrociliatus]